jgi:uncharacterized protein
MTARGGRRWQAVAGVAALAAVLPLAGCAAVLGGYDLAPNGLTRDEETFRRDLAFQAPVAYRSAIDGRRPLPEDDLLRLLYAGIAGRYAGAYDESSRLLDVASYLAEDRVTISLSREALSLVTSDRALAYVPGRTERLMIPYLAALNFLAAGDRHAAAVEARRIESLLDQLHGGAPADQRPASSHFLHYFAGAVFEAAGDWNAADVAYRRAGPLAATFASTHGAGYGSAPGQGSAAPAADSMGHVLVLIERGFVPHRVEQSVVIVLPPTQVRMLTDGSAGEKAVAAAEAAARILLVASHHGGSGTGFYRDNGYRSTIHVEPWRDDEEDEDDEGQGNPYLLRVSWPVLYQEPRPAAAVRVQAGEFGTDVIAHFDVAAGIRQDFHDQRAATLARTVARAAAKVAISAAVEHSVGERDETAGRIAGLLTNLGTLATERADTRGWHLLPGDIAMVRLRLPAGSHELTLAGDGSGGATLGTVTVRPGQTTFFSTRLWR